MDDEQWDTFFQLVADAHAVELAAERRRFEHQESQRNILSKMTIAEVEQLLDAMEDAASDCESVSRDESIDLGEKHAWIAVARKLRAALAKVGK